MFCLVKWCSGGRLVRGSKVVTGKKTGRQAGTVAIWEMVKGFKEWFALAFALRNGSDIFCLIFVQQHSNYIFGGRFVQVRCGCNKWRSPMFVWF